LSFSNPELRLSDQHVRNLRSGSTSMTLILILAHTAVLFASSPQVLPMGPGPDTVQSDRFKTLEWSDQLPQELDWYGSLGYRIVEIRGDVVRLERSSDSWDHREYLVLLPDKVSRTEALMNDAALRGFRFVPRALFVYNVFYSITIGVVMERVATASSSARLEYRIVSEDAWLLRTIEKQIIRASKEGYRLVGIKEATYETLDESDTENVAVLEKRDAFDQDVTATNLPLELELMGLGAASTKRLQPLTARGFRIVFAHNPFLMLEKMPGVDARPEYAVIAEQTRTDLQRAMNDAVQRGFRLIPGTFLTFSGLWKTWVTTRMVIMERTGDPGPEPEYIVAETEDDKELGNLVARGYTYLGGRIFMRLPSR
jgi:hypothetical protein